MPHDTYSGLLRFFVSFYIDIQIRFDNDIHRVFLDNRLAHKNVFYNDFFS